MTDAHNGVTFLCGRVKPGSEGLISLGIICLWDDKEIRVNPRDPGLKYIVPGRLRMVIVRDGEIVAVFGRPRIRLLLMLSNGVNVNKDLIDCYSPMYPRPEKIFRTTKKWKGTSDARDYKWDRRHDRHVRRW